MGLFRSEFSGRGELMERQQKLGQHLASLKALAAEHNVACLIVNQCTVYRGAMAIGITSEPRILPIGGHILAHGMRSTPPVFLLLFLIDVITYNCV